MEPLQENALESWLSHIKLDFIDESGSGAEFGRRKLKRISLNCEISLN